MKKHMLLYALIACTYSALYGLEMTEQDRKLIRAQAEILEIEPAALEDFTQQSISKLQSQVDLTNPSKLDGAVGKIILTLAGRILQKKQTTFNCAICREEIKSKSKCCNYDCTGAKETLLVPGVIIHSSCSFRECPSCGETPSRHRITTWVASSKSK